MPVHKRCAACKRTFLEEKAEPFVTCQRCRRPVITDGGGCHYWPMAAGDPRVTRHGEIVVTNSMKVFS